MLLHGTPDQKRKLLRECLTGESESSSDDEFQKEMEAELNTTVRNIEGKWKSPEMGKSFLNTCSPVRLRVKWCPVKELMCSYSCWGVCGGSGVLLETFGEVFKQLFSPAEMGTWAP